MTDIRQHDRDSDDDDDGAAGEGGARQRLVERTIAAAWWGRGRIGARYERLGLAVGVCVVAVVVAVVVARPRPAAPTVGSAASLPHPGVTGVSTSSVAPSTAGSLVPIAPAAMPLRSCAGLVGKPFSAALIGMKVTCSFGGRDIESRRVSVTAESCPDTSPFYIFRSTALDAVDRNVYYGSQGGPLLAAKAGVVTVAEQRREACTA